MIWLISRTSLPHRLCRGASHEPVRRAVEAIASDGVLGRDVAIDRVRVCRLGHRLVERGVEDRDVRDVGEGSARGANASDVSRVVQRGQSGEQGDAPLNVVVDDRWRGELCAALHHAVANHGELRQVEACVTSAQASR